jgi:hypothetical protein
MLPVWNGKLRPFAWKATAEVIHDKVRRSRELEGKPD